MIRLWLSREKSIPIREQLSAQLLFGILSRSIAPGERLPSVRDMARRLKVHPNTVSAAYRDLGDRGWVIHQRGSGVFVRALNLPKPEAGIEGFVRAWIEDGRTRGFTIEALETALREVRAQLRTQTKSPQLMVIHPDRDLACILAAEIEEAVTSEILFSGLDDAPKVLASDTCVLVTAACASAIVEKLQPVQYRVIGLNSMEHVLAGQHAPRQVALIGIVSRSQSVLQWSSKLLSALGFTFTDILQRNPAKKHWREGLGVCDVIAADVKAALELPPNLKPTVFRIVSDDFLREARELMTEQIL